MLDFKKVKLNRFPSKVIKSRKHYDVEFEMSVHMGAKEGVLVYKATCNGKEIGSTSIQYETD